MNEQDKVRAASLVDGLYKKTIDGAANWEESSDKNAYQAEIGNYVVQLVKEYDNEADDTYVKLIIRRYDGVLVDEITGGHIYDIASKFDPSMKYWQILDSMYDAARRVALGVDKAYDEILSYL